MKCFEVDIKSLRIAFINHIRKQWQLRGWLSYTLSPLSLLTLIYIWINTRLYKNKFKKTHTFKTPIIVVGNVVVGGAGKTPVVVELVNHLSNSGRRVGVVSKGYGRRKLPNTHPSIDVLEVIDTSPCELVGDEPNLI